MLVEDKPSPWLKDSKDFRSLKEVIVVLTRCPQAYVTWSVDLNLRVQMFTTLVVTSLLGHELRQVNKR